MSQRKKRGLLSKSLIQRKSFHGPRYPWRNTVFTKLIDACNVLLQLSLRTSTKRALLRTDSYSGFNLLQAAVLQGDYESVYKASTYLENFVEEMKSQTISNNASIFRSKSAVDILSALDCRKPGHADIETLYQRLVEIDETLNELHSCAKSGDVEKVIELVLNDGIDVNVAVKSNITPLLLASGMSSGVLIKTLIDLGADVNAQTAQVNRDLCFLQLLAIIMW